MSDAEIKNVLAQAGWTESETEAALSLLHTNAGNAESLFTPQSVKLGGNFRPDGSFSSDQISSLLGVDVELDPRRVRQRQAVLASAEGLRETLFRTAFASAIVALSLGIAASIGMGFFYILEIGPFRP